MEGGGTAIPPQFENGSIEVVAGGLLRRGDPNDDGLYNIADGIFLLDNLFSMGPNPNCEETADVNDDGFKNIADPIYLLDNQFNMGPPPPAPFPGCGLDPNPPGLGCNFYNSCP